MKQFKDRVELNIYAGNLCRKLAHNDPVEEFNISATQIADCLLADGYDLDNLTADGSKYEIDGHTNE